MCRICVVCVKNILSTCMANLFICACACASEGQARKFGYFCGYMPSVRGEGGEIFGNSSTFSGIYPASEGKARKSRKFGHLFGYMPSVRGPGAKIWKLGHFFGYTPSYARTHAYACAYRKGSVCVIYLMHRTCKILRICVIRRIRNI